MGRLRTIDVTRALGPRTPTFPGDPPIRTRVVADPRRGAPARVSLLTLGTHAGSHVDAPCHVPGAGEAGVEGLSLEALIGPAVVCQAPPGLAGPLGPEHLPRTGPPRILLRGDAVLSARGARALVARGALLVGTDGLSIDAEDDPRLPAHRILLAAGVVVLENLDLTEAPPGRYELIALPLLVPGADGAPARAVLRTRRSAGRPSGVTSGSTPPRPAPQRSGTRRRDGSRGGR